MNLQNMNVKTKILLSICSLAFLAFTITITFITVKTRNMIRIEAEDKVIQMAYRYSAIVKSELEVAMDAARTTAQLFEGLRNTNNIDRKQLNVMLKHLLEENPNFIGTWTCWEPNAIDNKDKQFINKIGHDNTGRFIPYWFRGGENIDVEPLVDYDKVGVGDYYLLSKISGEETILEPYKYNINGKETLITSVVVPIHHKGIVVGVAGIDISLDSFNEMVIDIKKSKTIYETGYISLISNNSVYVAHPDSKRIGQNVIDTNPWVEPFLSDISHGKQFITTSFSTTTSSYSWRVCVPIIIGHTATPWSILLSAPLDQIFIASQKITFYSIFICIISLIVFVIVTFIMTDSIVKPLNKLGSSIKDIAQGEGDLTQRLIIKNQDEIGSLAKWFNIFIKKLQGIITIIVGKSKELDDTSKKLSDISNIMVESASDMSSKSGSVATAAEEMSSNISSIAAAAEQSSTNITMVSAAMEEMTSTISEIAENTENTRVISNTAVTRIKKTSEIIVNLSELAQGIGQIVETINDISSQTNLLALNATIEAARAGKSGKGFAVVASEIKALAIQTAESTDDIREKIENIQESTKETSSEIQEITTAINNVSGMIDTVAAAVEEQSLTTKEITENITQAAHGVQEVTENVSQSSNVANLIAKDISDVYESASEMSNNSSLINVSATELNQLSQELNQTVEQFKI